MLVALVSIRSRDPNARPLLCIHVEHGIRPEPESRGDAEFVRSLCRDLRVPCRVVSVRQGAVARLAARRGIGIEAAARAFRRRAWAREAARIEAEDGGRALILTAHTADDALELVLMRVLRGAGPAGLALMPGSRGRFLRPMIDLSRADALAFLAEKGIGWREDATNADTRFMRNRVRHRLIPLLAREFPGWRAALATLARTQSLAADFIGREAGRVEWRRVASDTGVPASALETDAGDFFALPGIVREEALFRAADMLGAGAQVRREGLRRFSRGETNAADLGSARVERRGGSVAVSRRLDRGRAFEKGFALLINAPGSYRLKGVELRVSAVEDVEASPSEDTFLAEMPLVIRPATGADRLAGSKPGRGQAFCAEDRLGVAALFGAGGPLRQREGAAGGSHVVMIRLTDSAAAVVRPVPRR